MHTVTNSRLGHLRMDPFLSNLALNVQVNNRSQTIFDVDISFFPVPGDVWFSLRNKIYYNNSRVNLEEIGEAQYALLCITNLTSCCRASYALGNWFFPNGTRVPSSGANWDFHRTRGHMVVYLHRRRGGMEGIYHCEIPDSTNMKQTIYIGVYTPKSRECQTLS